MHKTVLVTPPIEDGRKLLAKLDEPERGFPVWAAVWFNDPERQAWKLVIVTSVATNPGPLGAYMKIQQAMSGLDVNFALDDILVMSPASQQFQEFKRRMEGVVGPSLLDPRGSSKPWAGTAFDDAYVYRW